MAINTWHFTNRSVISYDSHSHWGSKKTRLRSLIRKKQPRFSHVPYGCGATWRRRSRDVSWDWRGNMCFIHCHIVLLKTQIGIEPWKLGIVIYEWWYSGKNNGICNIMWYNVIYIYYDIWVGKEMLYPPMAILKGKWWFTIGFKGF